LPSSIPNAWLRQLDQKYVTVILNQTTKLNTIPRGMVHMYCPLLIAQSMRTSGCPAWPRSRTSHAFHNIGPLWSPSVSYCEPSGWPKARCGKSSRIDARWWRRSERPAGPPPHAQSRPGDLSRDICEVQDLRVDLKDRRTSITVWN
jgi:hypothetical protein